MSNDMGRKIRELREKCGLTQREVANAVGVTEATVSRWESGHINNMRRDKIQSLAKILQVSPLVIMGMKEKDREPAPAGRPAASESVRKKGVRIPVLGRVVAGIPQEAIQETIDWEEIPEEMARTGEYFGLRVKGDSMTPNIQEGDTLIIERQPDVDNRQIAIVGVNGGEATVKQIIKDPHGRGITLYGYNTDAYTPTFYSNEEIQSLPVIIYGRVVEIRRKLM